MSAEIRVPSMGESIAEATVGAWLKNEGDTVSAGDPVVELETEKANVEISAESGGVLERITKKTGDTVKSGDVVGVIGDGAGRRERGADGRRGREPAERAQAPVPQEQERPAGRDARAAEAEVGRGTKPSEPAGAPADEDVDATPVARRLAEERGVDLAHVKGTGRGGKVTREDVEGVAEPEGARRETPAEVAEERPAEREQERAGERPRAPERAREAAPERAEAEPEAPPGRAEEPRREERPEAEAQARLERAPAERAAAERGEERVRQTRRRQTIARRLVEAHQTAVMTTTFNEVDMTQLMELRTRRRESFKARFGVDLGFMSFFVRGVVAALKAYPRLNSSLDGEDVVLKRYYDIGIAVASDEGLVVPVLKDADRLSFAGIEKAIAGMVQRTRDRKLTLEELQGGTFTITNGGVFGSLMSTPILNPPQVGILGMHRAFDRPVAVEGKIEIRPMMYVALTYDHRVVDGADAVRFLVHVKGVIEDPSRLLVES